MPEFLLYDGFDDEICAASEVDIREYYLTK